MNNKMILFGSTGKMGKGLNKLCNFIIPLHREVDISNSNNVNDYIDEINPSIIVHSAALVGAKICEDEKEKAYNVNVIGTYNIAAALGKKSNLFIYVLTAFFMEKEGIIAKKTHQIRLIIIL